MMHGLCYGIAGVCLLMGCLLTSLGGDTWFMVWGASSFAVFTALAYCWERSEQ